VTVWVVGASCGPDATTVAVTEPGSDPTGATLDTWKASGRSPFWLALASSRSAVLPSM
jgi:hypothetical protein